MRRGAVALAACALSGIGWLTDDAARADEAGSALLRITGPEAVRLNAHSYLWDTDQVWDRDRPETLQTREADLGLIGLIEVEGASDGARFAVEGQPDAAANRYCRGGACFDVGLGVQRNGGLLYPRLQDYGGAVAVRGGNFRTDDFVLQRVEVSAEDSSSGLKVYRELIVEPPVRSAFCDDFPNTDASRFECVFNRPRQAAASWSDAEEAALVRNLPDKLVYDKQDYGLVFAEEFDGVPEEAKSCWNGMDTLDTAVWNYRGHKSCERVDSRGVACESVAGGHFRAGKSSTCYTAGINTHGKFAYRYGYLEVKYRFRIHQGRFYYNQNLVVGNIKGATRELWAPYGVVVDNYERIARYYDIEFDVFEEIPDSRYGISLQYINAINPVPVATANPRRTRRETRYCNSSSRSYALMLRPPHCADITTIVVTRGIEWTPRGYRNLLKVEGVHDDFIVFPESKTTVEEKPAGVWLGRVTFGSWTKLTGDTRSQFFELLDAADPDSRLDQVAIAHKPQSMGFGSWGYPKSRHRDIPSLLEVDYVRVFQPGNGYADMEPLYQ